MDKKQERSREQRTPVKDPLAYAMRDPVLQIAHSQELIRRNAQLLVVVLESRAATERARSALGRG